MQIAAWRERLSTTVGPYCRALQIGCNAEAVSSVSAESPLDEPYLHLNALTARAWMGKSGHGLSPENEAQAALAIHVACLHAATTNVMSRMGVIPGERRAVIIATAASRLSRAFDHALETYHRIKRGNIQVIRIEKVEVQPGARRWSGTCSVYDRRCAAPMRSATAGHT